MTRRPWVVSPNVAYASVTRRSVAQYPERAPFEAVQRTLKSAIRRIASTRGLPRIFEWIGQDHALLWLTSRRRARPALRVPFEFLEIALPLHSRLSSHRGKEDAASNEPSPGPHRVLRPLPSMLRSFHVSWPLFRRLLESVLMHISSQSSAFSSRIRQRCPTTAHAAWPTRAPANDASEGAKFCTRNRR